MVKKTLILSTCVFYGFFCLAFFTIEKIESLNLVEIEYFVRYESKKELHNDAHFSRIKDRAHELGVYNINFSRKNSNKEWELYYDNEGLNLIEYFEIILILLLLAITYFIDREYFQKKIVLLEPLFGEAFLNKMKKRKWLFIIPCANRIMVAAIILETQVENNLKLLAKGFNEGAIDRETFQRKQQNEIEKDLNRKIAYYFLLTARHENLLAIYNSGALNRNEFEERKKLLFDQYSNEIRGL
jgi:hypothetical protein